MSFEQTSLRGLQIYTPKLFKDHRGLFLKTFHVELFAEAGIQFELKEEFFSVSKKNVLRGMHFQKPPAGHAKMVTCLVGSVLDVVVDLRKEENTYGQFWTGELSAENGQVLYIPEGMAHGFLTLSDEALVHYKTSSMYDSQSDTGIRWDSLGFDWPVANPIVSQRDQGFAALKEFASPF